MTSTRLALALLLVGCSHPEPAPTTPTPSGAPPSGSRSLFRTSVPETADASAPLDVHVRVRAKHDKATRDIGPDETLHSNDFVELLVSVNAKAFVYAIQVFPDGNSDVLYPTDGDRAATPGAVMRIPTVATDWFQLDDVVGTETVYVLASRQPIAKIDEALSKEIGEIRAAASATPTPTPTPTSTSTPAPTPATPKPTPKPTPAPTSKSAGMRPTHTPPARMLSMASRGLHKVSRVEGAPEVSASADKDDGFVIAKFSFRHDH